MSMEIYNVPEGRRYWVVRANSCAYYRHFIEHGLIAIGHLDEIDLKSDKDKPFIPDANALNSEITSYHKSIETPGRSVSIGIGQINRFIYGIDVGDWVITIGSRNIHFGRVTGKPRLHKNILKVIKDKKKQTTIDMKYYLRRKVEWGPTLKRATLPFGLRNSLNARQTVFNLDRHCDTIYHTLYPFFIKKDRLHVSARINTKNKIKNYAMTSLFNILNEIEVIAKESDNGITPENFKKRFEQYIEDDKITITTKAEFHSPGDIWNTIAIMGGPECLHFVSAYILLFGNKYLGFDGLIDIGIRHKIADLILDRFKKGDIQKVAKSLALTTPKTDTKSLESDSGDEE